jgi:hypothetical protein
LLEFAVGDSDFRFVQLFRIRVNDERDERAPDELMNLCHARTIPRFHETMMKAA